MICAGAEAGAHPGHRPASRPAVDPEGDRSCDFHRLVLSAAVPLALAALLGSPASAHDISVRSNALTNNGLTVNALTAHLPSSRSALTTTGAALDDLDGVAVEAVTLLDDTRRSPA